MGLSCSSHAPARFLAEAIGAYPSRFLSGTHKNYSLVDCPIYSVVKNRVRGIAAASPPRRDLGRARANPRFGAKPTRASLAPNLKLHSRGSGGADRDRTGDLL